MPKSPEQLNQSGPEQQPEKKLKGEDKWVWMDGNRSNDEFFVDSGETREYSEDELRSLNEKLERITKSLLLKSVEGEHGDPDQTDTRYYLLTSSGVKLLAFKHHTGPYFSVARNGSWVGSSTKCS